MTVAAFVLSIVAVLIAGLSAQYTRRQAVSAEGTQKIEAARRHDELRPHLVGQYVAASDIHEGQRPGVKLTNEGLLDLDRVYVEAIPGHRANEAVIKGIYDHRSGDTAPGHETGRLRRGESWTLEVIPARDVASGRYEEDRGGTVQFRCTCHAAGHDPWVTIVSVDFPFPVLVF